MAERESASEVLPYRFEPVSVSNYSDNEDSTSESETDIREQASFTERLGSTSWCECVKCSTMSSSIECQCCREMESAVKRIAENENYCCITDHEQFKIVCYTALVMMNTVRGDPISLPLPNRYVIAVRLPLCANVLYACTCRSYRLAAYRQFIYWTHSRLGKGIRKVIPSCIVLAIRQEFPEADNVYTGFKIFMNCELNK